jgi:long-chain acyl-CoA synthetase
MRGSTLYGLFRQAAFRHPDAVALALPGGQVAYSKFHAQTMRLAGAIRSAESSAPLAIITDDSEAFLIAFFACAAIGKPAFPLDPSLPPSQISKLLQRHPPAAIFAPPKISEALSLSIPAIWIDEGVPSSERLPLPGVDSGADFYWGLTSGTTGDAKVFARSHASWTASFDAAETVFSFPAASQVLIPGPLHHSLFLYGAVHALCRGLTVLLPGPFKTSRVASMLPAATHLYAVPFMLGELAKLGRMAPALSAVFSGGAKLDAELRQRCEALWPGADIIEFYGASETSFLTYHSTRQPAKRGSVGRPFPGVTIEIRGAGGALLPRGEEGQIFSSGPMLFSRYIDEPSVSGWFSVGDTGFIDEGGSVHLTGRINRIINSKALKIRPEAVEAALLELPEVRRAAVVDLPDARRGAVAVAAIEFQGDSLDRRRLSAHCRARLGPRLCPRRYYAADALPLTSSGKVAVARIREALLEKDPAFEELA